MVDQLIIILASYYIEVGIGFQLFHSEVAAHRPDLVVIARRDILFAVLSAQFDLLPADHTTDRVHWHQIGKTSSAPLVGEDHAVLKRLLHLGVRLDG